MGRDHKEKKDKKDKKDKKEKREKEKRLREAFNEERAEEEERHARKSQKKIEKVAKLLGYDNDTNPFGDSNLLKPFEWGKKKDKDTAEGRKSKTGSEKEAERMTLIKDIDRVRQRRIEREQEQEEMERLRNEEQRLREAANYGDWQKKEEDFHIDQTRMRSKIRLSENREKPIDTLAKNILLLEEITREECKGSGVFGDGVDMSHLSMELRNPEQVLQTLDNEELSTLSRDVRAYLQLEEKKAKNSSSSSSSSGSSSSGSSEELALQYNGNYSSFWAAMETLVLFEQQKREAVGSVHHNVTEDLEELFTGKTDAELAGLEAEIRDQLSQGEHRENVEDSSYWGDMLRQLAAKRASGQVSRFHQALVARKGDLLEKLRARGDSRSERHKQFELEMEKARKMEESARAASLVGGADGRDVDGGGLHDGDEDALMAAASEIAARRHYSWQDKFRPRKPKFINKVRTGWDWNKYNRAHYDMDNPPPKAIQGYKFYIFYPDLMDMTKTPRYFVERASDDNFCIIRFSAGPPYEDVAFQVLNREWDANKRAGFKSTFDRGVLQLHFNFKRERYRR